MVTLMSSPLKPPPGMVAAKAVDAQRTEKTKVRKKCMVMMIRAYRLREVKY